MKIRFTTFITPFACLFLTLQADAFQGRIHTVFTQGAEMTQLLYTVGTNSLRVEVTATNWPNPVDVLDLKSGELTLFFPHNRSYMRLKAPLGNSLPRTSTMPMPAAGMPPGIGPQPLMPASSGVRMPPGMPAGTGPSHLPGFSAAQPVPQSPGLSMPGGMPLMAAMPMMGGRADLVASGGTTNILGFVCTRYEFKRRGETMEIWATDQLLPYQHYVRNQPRRFGPPMIEEQWPESLKAKKLFPLLAILKFENGPERYRFEVKLVTPEEIKDPGGKLFAPPPDYRQIEPLPF